MPDLALSKQRPAVGAWENEGGALASSIGPQLPVGVSCQWVAHYSVGRFHYSSLSDALAELARQQARTS